MKDPNARSGEHAMDDTMEMKFQDIMEFVAEDHTNNERGITPMIQFDDDQKLPARIKVIGVGGGGNNAVSTMALAEIMGVEFIAANTDRQALEKAKALVKVLMGSRITGGMGAGSNPEIGRKAALEDADKIKAALSGADMVFVTAGMGGGTGTGGAPVIAQIAREGGALTVAVVTKPFEYEGEMKKRKAEEGIAELKKHVDALIVIPNERLLNLAEKNTPLLEMFRHADSVLVQAVKGISDVVMIPGLVNVDFADLKTVMANRGRAVMGTGVARGEGRAMEATHKAISSSLLEDGSIKGARGVLINVTGGQDLGMLEHNEAISVIKNEVDPNAEIKCGIVINPVMSEEIMVTVLATGFDEEGVRSLSKRPSNLKEFRKTEEKPHLKRRPELSNTGDLFGGKNEDLDKPAYLRRAVD